MDDKNNELISNNLIVDAQNVSMEFVVPRYKYDTLKERAINYLKGNRNKAKIFRVLDNVSFQIKKGESLGVIGHNGAGKSTLLKIVAGILPPTEGSVKTNGHVVLLNLGSGFDMEANAVENIYLNGAICGFSRKQMKERFDSIVHFAELEDFLSLPLKNYSSGMVSRLGFAIAIDVHPDLLLIDEVLSVGDINFQNKCKAKIKEMQEDGTSIMFVSHSPGAIEAFCDKTIWIEDSEVMAYGPTKEVVAQYLAYSAEKDKKKFQPKLCAVICTYKREQFVLKNIEKLRKCQPNICHVIVVDNGSTLDTNLSDDFVTIVHNKNLGGTGGFTRGMIEAKKGNYTHVLLMDDDIDFDPKTYRIAYEKLCVNGSYAKKDWIGFSMYPFDTPYMQFEMGAKWNGIKSIVNNHNLDMRIPKNLAKNEIHQVYNYSGWWSLIMPLSVIDDYGYPFPFFIKFDDIEYGMRRKKEDIIFSNDFKIQHESFDKKYVAYLEYYLCRNALITNAIHLKLCTIKSTLKIAWKVFKFFFKHKPDSMRYTILGAKDYLAGPNQFYERDMKEYNDELRALTPIADSFKIRCHYLKEGITTCLKLLLNYRQVRKQYLEKYPDLTSLEYWKKVLNLNED